MSLYLCVIDGNGAEIDGVEVGPYSYFGRLREVISQVFGSDAESILPHFLGHSDCCGHWSIEDITCLQMQLKTIRRSLVREVARPIIEDVWYISAYYRIHRADLFDSLIEINGEPLIDQLLHLCSRALEHDLPILFQ